MIPTDPEAGINVIVPKVWILANIDTAVEKFPPNPSSYRAFGGFNAKETSDGANSVSKAHRDGGYMFFFSHSDFNEHFSDLFPLMFDTSDLSNFPGFIGSNHAGPNAMGPLKSDWTKACPLDWTPEERDEKCKSVCGACVLIGSLIISFTFLTTQRHFSPRSDLWY
jgi:hypothetical protein